jgi:hypothetical protein
MSDAKNPQDAKQEPKQEPLKLKLEKQLGSSTAPGLSDETRQAIQRAGESAEQSLAREREFAKLRDEIAQKTRRAEDATEQAKRLDGTLRRQQGELRAWRYGAGAIGIAGALTAWVLLRRRRAAQAAPDSFGAADSSFTRDSENEDPGYLSVADLAGPADPFDQGANRFDVGSLYEAPLDLEDDLLRDSQPPANDIVHLQSKPNNSDSQSTVVMDSMSTAPATSVPAPPLAEPAPTPKPAPIAPTAATVSLRERLFGPDAESSAPQSPALADGSPSEAASSASAPSASAPGQMPDLRWVPQPMQELLALNRALTDWRANRQWPVAEQALLHHIRTYPDTSAWVYMELFQLYRAMDKRHEFEEWSMRYRTQFNRLAPTWQESAMEGKGLMRYDLALSQLTQAWAQGRTMWLLEQWLVGEAFMRRLMDPGACREVLFLYELCLSLGEMVRDARGGVSTPRK